MNSIEKHIRCKCGKVWGMDNLKVICTRCQTEVKARGEIGNKEHKKIKVIPSVDYNEWKSKYGLKPSRHKIKKSKYKVKKNLN